MAQGGRLIFTFILQCITVSLANQNHLVPIFISEIGKPFITLTSNPNFKRRSSGNEVAKGPTSFSGLFPLKLEGAVKTLGKKLALSIGISRKVT